MPHYHERGSVTLGGRRVPVSRPRVPTADSAEQLPVASYELFNPTEVLGRMAMDRIYRLQRDHHLGPGILVGIAQAVDRRRRPPR